MSTSDCFRIVIVVAAMVALMPLACFAQRAVPGPNAGVPDIKSNASMQTTAEDLTLSPPAQQLAEHLHVLGAIEELKAKGREYERKGDTQSLLELTVLRQKLIMALQHASIEVEEAVAAIDNDLTLANMLLAYASSKQDHALVLNNVEAFVGSGAFGLLDSSTSIKINPPTPNIFGILGNSVAIGVPLWGLRRHQYENPRRSQHTNMLAPIFGRPFSGESYDPLIWQFIDGMPDPNSKQTKRQMLLQRWQSYRGVGTTGSAAQQQIDALVGMPNKDNRVTVDLLKTRSELLFDLRGVVQMMYRDISELNRVVISL